MVQEIEREWILTLVFVRVAGDFTHKLFTSAFHKTIAVEESLVITAPDAIDEQPISPHCTILVRGGQAAMWLRLRRLKSEVECKCKI